MILSVFIPFLLLGCTPAVAQLPPEIQADSYLLRAEQANGEGDHLRARAEIDKIILLEKEHGLDLPDEFHFRYAKAASAAGLPEQAHKAVVKYLTMAGREGTHYVEALELMNRAQEAIEGQQEAQSASSGQSLPVQAATQESVEAEPETVESTEAQQETTQSPPDIKAEAVSGCEAWNTKEFFETATQEAVTACLEAGADVAASVEDGRTPLHQAARYNESPAVVEVLLAAGADLNAKATDDGHTPLHEAAANNKNLDVLQALLTAGADPMTRDGKGGSLLGWAAVNENAAVIELLLNTEIDPNASDEEDGYTPLHWAARYNENPEVVMALQRAEADPMARAKDGSTPLHWAALGNESLAVFQVLLEAGADVEARTEKDYTPLHWAAMTSGNPAIVEALLAAGAEVNARNEDSKTPLHLAGQVNKSLAVFQVLLEAGADVDAKSKYGETPLYFASKRNDNLAVIQALLAAGADIAAQNINGETLLHAAVFGGDAIDPLLAAGANPNLRDDNGETPLHKAALFSDNPRVFDKLIAAGANVHARDQYGNTPLFKAIISANVYAVRALLGTGASVTVRDQLGETPLHDLPYAANNDPDDVRAVVEACVAAGADVNAQDQLGNTPLHEAAAYRTKGFRENPQTGKLERYDLVASDPIVALLDAGADPTIRNNEGESAWDLAQENEPLRETDAYWRMNDARFNAPGADAIRKPAGGGTEEVAASSPAPARNTQGMRGEEPSTIPSSAGGSSSGGSCLIPNYPNHDPAARFDIPWCTSGGPQVETFAMYAAAIQCALSITEGAEHIRELKQRIATVCGRLDAMQRLGGNWRCQCPRGFGQ